VSKVNHPLAEVLGFPTTNQSAEATRYRKHRLCRFHNKVPNCTKDKAKSPLGVCSVFEGDHVAITCPIRFNEDWLIAEDAADFFFPEATTWTSLTEVRLHDKHGGTAGNIDIVLVAYDSTGKVLDFGALEIQAVYISGNVRRPFEHYMEDPAGRAEMDWTKQANYPRPDYLSSSRKRLAPQLLYKGGILKAWGKKVAVALDRGFFQTLPKLRETEAKLADVAWLVYDLQFDTAVRQYRLSRYRTVYTTFGESLDQITHSEPGDEENFIRLLQSKLDKHLRSESAPDTKLLEVNSVGI